MNNFEFVCKKRFNEINNNLYMYKHSSGLSLYYYPNMTSNSFSVVTRIKENDTSEVFHILEHMLCRGNKDNKYFDLATFFKKIQSTKFRATTNFSNIFFQFENKDINEYFGLANILLDNVFNPSLLKEDF
ncbi:MAG: hypothetical protein MJ246_01020 [Clostridia bacterium]|nr:hypothetical protein [Clostridia bacterium]